MIAYYVYDETKAEDRVIIPDMGCAVPVDENVMADFCRLVRGFVPNCGTGRFWFGDCHPGRAG